MCHTALRLVIAVGQDIGRTTQHAPTRLVICPVNQIGRTLLQTTPCRVLSVETKVAERNTVLSDRVSVEVGCLRTDEHTRVGGVVAVGVGVAGTDRHASPRVVVSETAVV